MSRTTDETQFEFLSSLKRTAWIFLVYDIKLTGVIESFDKIVVALRSQTGTQTVCRSAISTICEWHAQPPKREQPRDLR